MDVEQRLRNWGRWSRTGTSVGNGSSPIYRLMRENDPGSATEPVVRGVCDELDAIKVDKAITRAHMYPYEREMLKLRYIYLYEKTGICRKEAIRFRDFSRLLEEAKAKVQHELEFDV